MPVVTTWKRIGTPTTVATANEPSISAKTNAAAYLAVWSFIRRGAEEGCRVFDFGGIDPAHNRGVYDFKRGLTRNVASSGPLWLYGRNRLVTAAAGAVLAR